MALYLGIGNDGNFITSDGYSLKDSNNLFLTATPESSKYKVILNNTVYKVILNLKGSE